ncbi:MAG: hypothetical protein ACK56I_34765, partial [bacterium]
MRATSSPPMSRTVVERAAPAATLFANRLGSAFRCCRPTRESRARFSPPNPSHVARLAHADPRRPSYCADKARNT